MGIGVYSSGVHYEQAEVCDDAGITSIYIWKEG